MTDTIRILHVEADPAFADLTTTHLRDEEQRFTITSVRDVSAALDHLTAAPVDCIVSNYELPDQDGIALLRSTREEFPDLPFVLFTGKGTEEVASEAISAGVTDYVQKETGTDQFKHLANRIVTAVENYRTQHTLERQRDLFRKAQALANVGAWEYDPVSGNIYFSEEIYNIYGVDTDYDPDPDADIERFYHPDDRDTVRTATRRALDVGEEYDIEVRITAADGTEKWIRTRGKPEFTDGTCQRVRGTIQDITDQKQRERELRQQKERMEEFANVVSHDLRNPLNVVSGRLEMVQAECDSSHFETITDAIGRMERIIEDVLWLAHEGRAIGETQAVDLRRTAERLWPMVSDTSEHVDLVINGTDSRVVIDADADRLAQLLENLFRNAIDHGGSDVTVRFETTETGFAVEDDGPGIPPDEQDHVLKTGYSTDEGGTGLGLSIVKRIVDAHGWEIRVTEGRDGGARFEISGVEFVR
ncbi:ATP-binding response regulator [Halohasta salina]|uniref:ATP-binding response regulator n=1 Tax=Halohasta salina TaxID=2961621 RepID=UPI0020A24F6D|nr:ATP-binding protein [Halohasta salina]